MQTHHRLTKTCAHLIGCMMHMNMYAKRGGNVETPGSPRCPGRRLHIEFGTFDGIRRSLSE